MDLFCFFEPLNVRIRRIQSFTAGLCARTEAKSFAGQHLLDQDFPVEDVDEHVEGDVEEKLLENED